VTIPDLVPPTTKARKTMARKKPGIATNPDHKMPSGGGKGAMSGRKTGAGTVKDNGMKVSKKGKKSAC
jgi:hypothetical protein